MGQGRTSACLYLLAFSAGFALRLIPDLVVGPYIVGYEVLAYYAPGLMDLRRYGLLFLLNHLTAGFTLYTLAWLVYAISNPPPALFLKALGPLLYGLLSASFLFFLRRGLGLEKKPALMATLACISQPTCLRVGWDRYMSMMGLVPMFLALGLLGREHEGHEGRSWSNSRLALACLALLAVLGRELVASIFLAALTGYVVLKRQLRVDLALTLASCYGVFMLMVLPYLGLELFPRPGNRFACLDFEKHCPLPILMNYLPEEVTLTSYLALARKVVLFFLYAHFPILAFALAGAFREPRLDGMVAWLLLGALINPLVFPFASVPFHQRWATLLVFPFCAYMGRWFSRIPRRRACLAWVLVLAYLAVGAAYMSGLFSYPYGPENDWIPIYIPRSSLRVHELEECKICLSWLNKHADNGSCLLVEERFRGPALLYTREDIFIIMYWIPGQLDQALKEALSRGFEHIYLLWYSGLQHKGLRPVFSYGSFSIYLFYPTWKG